MSKLQKIIDGVLAVFLLALIFLFGFKTVWPNRIRLLDAARSQTRLLTYMPADYTQLEKLAARIRSTEDRLNEVLWKKDELGWFNSSVQYALGKKMINTGASSMITLPTGDLYDLPAKADPSPMIGEILTLRDSLDVPFLYVFEHPTTYPGNQPEGGYAMLDHGDELSESIVTRLRDGGVNLLDSREILKDEDTAKTILRTDQHWTYYAGLVMAKNVAEKLGLDAERLDPVRFDTQVFPEKFMGKYGQKIGTANVKPDDITVFWPTYDTEITRYTLYNDDETTITGPFKDSVIKWNYLEGDGWNIEAYKAYGLTEDFEHFHNEDGADLTILMFKDSFGSPIGHFLSLTAKDVYLVDMRKTDRTAMDFVEEIQPDQVVMAYSQQMICAYDFHLIEQE